MVFVNRQVSETQSFNLTDYKDLSPTTFVLNDKAFICDKRELIDSIQTWDKHI